MAKVRVYELAKEFGVESKAVMDQLKEMGEFVRSASSTIEAPVVRRLKEAFAATAAPQDQRAAQDQPSARSRSAGTSAPRDGAGTADGGRSQAAAGPRPGGTAVRGDAGPDGAAPAPRVAPDDVADVTGRAADQAGAVAPGGASPGTAAAARQLPLPFCLLIFFPQ